MLSEKWERLSWATEKKEEVKMQSVKLVDLMSVDLLLVFGKMDLELLEFEWKEKKKREREWWEFGWDR